MWKLNSFIKDMNVLAQHTELIPKKWTKRPHFEWLLMSLLWVRMIPERWSTCGSYDPGPFVLNALSLYGWILHYCGGQKDRKGCIMLLKCRQALLWIFYESGQRDEIWSSLFTVCCEEIPFRWSSCRVVCFWASSCRSAYTDVSPKLTVNTLIKENSQPRWWSLLFLQPRQGPAQACGLLPHKKNMTFISWTIKRLHWQLRDVY